MARTAGGTERTGYALIDAGDRRRLEAFGARTVDRYAPGAEGRRQDLASWLAADLRFDAGRWWQSARPMEAEAIDPWPVDIDGLTLELRATSSGGVGLYPEHADHLPWLHAQIAARTTAEHRPTVLNLFAHTGLITLAAARAGAAVTHVDASRNAVSWARRNAELSGFAERPIRWIVDDAAAFVSREARREQRYDGIVLDPPSFGRAGRRQWRLVDELPALLETCRAVAADGAFVLLTAHTTGLDGAILKDMLRAAFPIAGSRFEAVEMGVESSLGEWLNLGWGVRLPQ
jgi:23S rRNA (cytosine1962-C5)-methyltransferase